MMLLSSVTAPVRATARPVMPAPLFNVMLACATIVPIKVVVVPSVAELPTCQNTLHAVPLLVITTVAPLAVVSVLPILKTNTAAESPCASSVRVPVNWADES